MKVSRFLLPFVAASAMVATAAHADTFNFSYGTAGTDTFYGSGTLTGSLSSPGVYQITDISGTTNTGGTTQRKIVGLSDFEGADNQVDVTATGYSFDFSGLSYELGNGALVNLFFNNGEILERTNGNGVTQAAPITITAATPEPGSFVLLGTGLLGAVGVARRRLFA